MNTTTQAGFERGQSVIVRAVRDGVPQPAFDGVFLGYWRNGLYAVRETTHNTQCVYKLSEIHAAGVDRPRGAVT